LPNRSVNTNRHRHLGRPRSSNLCDQQTFSVSWPSFLLEALSPPVAAIRGLRSRIPLAIISSTRGWRRTSAHFGMFLRLKSTSRRSCSRRKRLFPFRPSGLRLSSGAFRTSPRASPCILFAPSTLPTRLLFAFIAPALGWKPPLGLTQGVSYFAHRLDTNPSLWHFPSLQLGYG